MTDVGQPFGVTRWTVVWLLSTMLWIVRLAYRPWVWFSVFFTLYGLLGFLLSGRVIPAAVAAIGCTASAWLHMRLYRQLTSGELV